MKDAQKSTNLNKNIIILAVACIGILVSIYFFMQFFQPKPVYEVKGDDTAFPAINPLDMTQTKKQAVNLYYRYNDTVYLVSQTRDIESQPDERIEEAVLRELISGPTGTSDVLRPLIPTTTKVVNLETQGETIYVTFNSELLLQDRTEIQQDDTRLHLMTQSIINSLLDLGTYSKVQILVDKNGTGQGERLPVEQFGFQKLNQNASQLMEAQSYDNSVVWTPNKMLAEVIYALNNHEWSALYAQVSDRDRDGVAKPIFDVAAEAWQQQNCGILDYDITSTTQTAQGTTILRVDFTGEINSSSYTRTNFPIVLVYKDYTWKIHYDVLMRMISREELA